MEGTDEELKHQILGAFDFAFRIDWEKEHHKKIHRFLTSLTMYTSIKMNGHIASTGSFLAYRFNDRASINQNIEKFRILFRAESPETFEEEECNGCRIFKI